MSVVNKAIDDGVGQGWIITMRMPRFDWHLTRNERALRIEALGRLGVPSTDACLAPDPLPVVAVLGLEFSLGDFLQNDLVDRQVRHRLLEPSILRFELPHPLGMINLQPNAARASAIASIVRYSQLLAGLHQRLTLTDQHIGLAQFMNDLLGSYTVVSP